MKKYNIDYTTKDYEGYRNAMLNRIRVTMPEYTDLSPNDTGVVIVEALATALDILSYNTDVVANEMFLGSARELESVTKRATELGYNPFPSSPALVEIVMEIEPQEENVVFPKGTVIHTDEEFIEDIVFFELAEDFEIPYGKTGLEKDEETGLYLYRGLAIEGESVQNEVLGGSSGLAGQRFTLNYFPVILDDSLEILVNNGLEYEKWERVDNFLKSKNNDKHYTLTTDAYGQVTIQFGDDNTGKIPEQVASGIVANYRVGGGVRGNLAPNTLTEFQNKPDIAKEVFNPYTPLIPGLDRESIESIKVNTPVSLRTQERAVTEDDFVDVLMLRPEVHSVGMVADEIKEHVNLYAVVKEEFTLNDSLLGDFNDYMKERALIGVSVDVHRAKEKKVEVKLLVKYMENYDTEKVKKALEEKVEKEFALENCYVGVGKVIPRLYTSLYVDGIYSLEILNQEFSVNKDEILVLDDIIVSEG